MNPCFCSSHYDGVISVWPLPWQVPLLLHRAAFIAGVRVIRNDLFWTHRSAFVGLPPTDSHSRSESTQRRPDSCSTSKLYNSWETCRGQFWEVVFIAPDGIFWGSWDTWGMRINHTCHAFWVLFTAFLSTPSIVIWIYLLFGWKYMWLCMWLHVCRCACVHVCECE